MRFISACKDETIEHPIFLDWRDGLKRLVIMFLASALISCGPAKQTGANGDTRSENTCTGLPTNEMTWIPAGGFIMGENPRYPEEGPPREITVKGFWLDVHEVTNAEFAAFIEATGYITMAERDPPKTPNAPPEMLKPGSAVFNIPTPKDRRWWRWEVGAQWRHPSGTKESIEGGFREPVVQIAYQDAQAYAKWAGKELPSEAQWEYAARGGEDVLPEPIDENGVPQANYYQGVFPAQNINTDGFIGRAPVGCFKVNGYGLHDMLGNVWEWTSQSGSRIAAMESVNVIKGGSFLCAENYCARYRPSARQFQERGLGTDHIGFRLVDNILPPPAH